MIKSLKDIYKPDPTKRLKYLLFKLLITGEINISQEMDALGVARNTIKADLKKLSAELSETSLSLNERKLVFNDELEVRKFILNHFWDDYMILFSNTGTPISNPIEKMILEDFSASKFHELIDDFNELTENYKLTSFYETFLLNVLIATHRLMYGYTILNTENEDNAINQTVSEQVKKLVNKLEQHTKLTFSALERQQLAHILVSYDDRVDNPQYQKNILNIKLFVSNLIEKISTDFEMNLKNDAILIGGLYQHIKSVIYRKQVSFEINNEIYQEAIKNFQPLFVALESVIRKSQKDLGLVFKEEDITLIAVHFLGAVRRYQEMYPTVMKVLLVCQSGYGTSVLLKNLLEKNYNVEIIDTVSIYQIQEQMQQKPDLLISTLKIPYELENRLKIPVLFISPFLTFNDDQRLKNMGITRKLEQKTIAFDDLNKILKKYAKVIDTTNLKKEVIEQFPEIITTETKDKSMIDLLTDQDITIIKTPIDWETSLKIAAKPLINRQAITENYLKEITASVFQYGSHFIIRNGIAIPHGSTRSGVITSGIQLLFSENEIVFPTNLSSRLIFFIASPEKELLINTVMDINKLSFIPDLYEHLNEAIKQKYSLANCLKTLVNGDNNYG